MRRPNPCIALFATTLAFGASLPGRALAERSVRVGVFEVEPLVFLEDGEPRGFYIDLLAEIARQQAWTLDYRVGTWDASLQALESGALDLLGPIGHSDLRDEGLDFTSQPVITLWSQVYVAPGSSVRNILDLEHQSVAIMKGDINGQHFREYIAQFAIDCDILEVSSLADVFAHVASGAVVAGIAPNVFDYANASKYQLLASPIIFAPFAVHFAVPQGKNGDLIAALDATLSEWHQQENSFYRQSLHRWFGGGEFEKSFIPSWLWTLLAVVTGVTLILILWNRLLNVQVRSRTLELRRSEERYRTLFESAGDAILMMKDGQFIECNAKTLELFRCTRAKIIGHEPREFSPERQPDGRLSSEAAAQHIAVVEPGGSHRFEWTHRRADGTDFEAEVTLTRFTVGDEAYMHAIVRDTTTRKRLESDLRQAQKMEAIGTLAGGIAHDFNNVLSAIVGFSELARLYVGDDEKVVQNLAQVMVATERARDLVQQILAFSRRSVETHQATELAPIVTETLQLLRSTIPATVEIVSQIDAPGPVLADPTGLRQIIMNLATNARQAIGEDSGKITVTVSEVTLGSSGATGDSVRPPGDYVLLAISDTGPGMDESLLDKIFEPYFTTKRAKRGSGLGLAVVHRLVEEHQGRIEVESAPGKGATFRVWLPKSSHRPYASGAAVEIAKPVGTERVLFIDDEDAIVNACKGGLEHLGYSVTGFTRPEDALTAFRASPDGFDVVITDMTMPQMTGVALATAVLQLRPETPVVLCTGYSDTVTREAAEQMGIRAFLMKPLGPRRLAIQIRDLCDG